MPRTLADMTPQEREDCKGMWCEFEFGMERHKAVLTGVRGEECSMLNPRVVAQYSGYDAGELTLLPDLPRAWGADREPVKMGREWGIFYRPLVRGQLRDEDVHLITSEEERVDETMEHMREQEQRGWIASLRLMTRAVTDWEAKP